MARIAAARQVGQHLKYDQHVLANHGIALAGVAHDTLLESYVLESDREPTTSASSPSRHLGLDTIQYESVAGRGQADRLRRSISARRPVFAEDSPTSPASCIRRCYRGSRPTLG